MYIGQHELGNGNYNIEMLISQQDDLVISAQHEDLPDSFIIEIEIKHYSIFFAYLFLSSFIMGAVGFIAGLWADKFDNMATVTNFIIVPLSFLSGTFYSIERLPPLLNSISKLNPFFYIIDGFRYGFLGTSDSRIEFGLFYLTILSFLFWFIAYILFKKGYKIKS